MKDKTMNDTLISLLGSAVIIPPILAYICGTFDAVTNRVIVKTYRTVRRYNHKRVQRLAIAKLNAEFAANKHGCAIE
jgi:hypothetical protein